MTRARPFIPSLNGGEVDSEAIARSDLQNYANKAEIYENALPAVKGGWRRAPGSRFIGNSRNNGFCVLRPWRYSNAQAFVLEYTAGHVRVIQGTGFIQTGPGLGVIGAWVDASTGTGSSSAAAPAWSAGPWDSDFGSTNKPVLLTGGTSGKAKAHVSITTATPTAVHSVAIVVQRNWVDLRLGTSVGGAQISIASLGPDVTRLEPGYHIISFTPGVSPFYLDVEASSEGKRGLKSVDFLGVGDLTLPTPYTQNDLRSIRSDQAGDERWVWLTNQAQRMIERRTNQSWSMRAFRSDDGPFRAANLTTISITPSAIRGEVTLTATDDVFKVTHKGALWQFTEGGQQASAALTAADTYASEIKVQGVGAARLFTLAIAGTWVGTIELQRSIGNDVAFAKVQDWTANDSGPYNDGLDNQTIYYRLGFPPASYTSGTANVALTYTGGASTAVVRIIDYTDTKHVTADVISPFPSTTAVTNWAEGDWSDYRGWPQCGALFDGRLFLARAISLWASTPDGFTSFEVGPNDNDGINRQIATGDVSPAQWLKAAARLLVGTEAAEPQIRSTTFEEPITPLNMTIRQGSTRGSANIDAIRLDTSILFINRTGQRLFRLVYDLNDNAYHPQNLTRLNEEIAGDTGFVDMCFQQEPEPRLWCVRADGQLAVVTFSDDEQVVGWGRICSQPSRADADFPNKVTSVGGVYESCAAIPGTPEDYVYASCQRRINGQIVRHIERFERERWTARADAWRVHDGLQYTGAPATTFAGFMHLIGQTVRVWGDGAELGEFVVSNTGTVGPVGYPVSNAIIGLGYDSRFMGGKLPFGAQAGTAVGQIKSLDHVTLLVHRTPPGAIKVGPSFAAADLVNFDDLGDGFTMDEPPPLFTGEATVAVDCAKKGDPRICWEVKGAGPAQVLGYVVNELTNESS